MSPAENSLFPVANIYDGRPDAAFRFSAASTDEATVTVDGNILRNGSLDAWSGANPDNWGTDGTVAESTNARSGSAARVQAGTGTDRLRQDVTVRAGQRLVLEAYTALDSTEGSPTPLALVQNLETGKYFSYNDSGWTVAENAAAAIQTTSTFAQVGPQAFTVEDFGTVGRDTCTVRISYILSAGTSNGLYVDDSYLWPAVDFASVHGHNIRQDVVAHLRSSPDDFASSATSSTITRATMTKGQPSFYSALSSAIDDRYWRLRLVYSPFSTTGFGAPPTESVWIGELVIGQATELTRPQDLGQELRVITDNVRSATPYGHMRVHRFAERPRRILGMSFNFFTSDEYQEARQEVFERSFGSANPIVVVPDDSQPEVLHGRINDEWAVRQTLETHFTDNDLVVVEDAFPVWTE